MQSEAHFLLRNLHAPQGEPVPADAMAASYKESERKIEKENVL